MRLDAVEKLLIAEALRRNGGNRKRTAGELGIDVSTLFRKVRQLGIEAPQKDGRGRRNQ
jgi:DNA-binding NtrC family response regulator